MTIAASPANQSATITTPNSGTSQTNAIGFTPTAGRTLIFRYRVTGTTAANRISIPNGGLSQPGVTWTRLLENVNTETQDWWVGVVGAGATDQLTINFAGTKTFNGGYDILEWVGVSASLVTSSTASASSTSPASAAVTPTAGIECIALATYFKNGSCTTTSNGWTLAVAGGSGLSYLVVSSASGSYSTAWGATPVGTAQNWDATAVVLTASVIKPPPLALFQFTRRD